MEHLITELRVFSRMLNQATTSPNKINPAQTTHYLQQPTDLQHNLGVSDQTTIYTLSHITNPLTDVGSHHIHYIDIIRKYIPNNTIYPTCNRGICRSCGRNSITMYVQSVDPLKTELCAYCCNQIGDVMPVRLFIGTDLPIGSLAICKPKDFTQAKLRILVLTSQEQSCDNNLGFITSTDNIQPSHKDINVTEYSLRNWSPSLMLSLWSEYRSLPVPYQESCTLCHKPISLSTLSAICPDCDQFCLRLLSSMYWLVIPAFNEQMDVLGVIVDSLMLLVAN